MVVNTEAREQLVELVDAMERTGDRVTVTRGGRPAAVLMTPSELAALEETIAVLSDEALTAQLDRARADVAAGRTSILS